MELIETSRIAGCVRAVRLDASGNHLAVLSSPREDLILCDLAGGLVRGTRALSGSAIGSDVPLVEMAFHPQEPLLAVVGQNRPITVWDVSRGVRVAEFGAIDDKCSRLEHGFWGVTFSPCGRYVDSHSLCRQQGERYDWQTGHLVAKRWGPGGPLALPGGGDLVAVCSVREMATLVFFGRWKEAVSEWYTPQLTAWFPVTRAAFGPGFLGLVGGSRRLNLQVHEFPSCKVRFSLELDRTPEHVEFPFDVSEALAIDGEGRIFGPTCSGEIVEWASADGAEAGRCQAHQGMVMTMDLHPSEPLLVSGGWDGTISVTRISESFTPAAGGDVTERFLDLFDRLDGDPESVDEEDLVMFEP